jgi:pilus assembly protein Flp/PilA
MLFELAVLAVDVVRFYRSEWRNESGATAVEYGLMVGLIAAVIMALAALLGQEVVTAFQNFINSTPWAPAP